MNFKKLLSEKPFKYDSPHGIGATRNLWCHAKIKGDKKWFPCNWKGLIDRIEGWLWKDKGTKISKDEQKSTIKEWMDILFGPKEERYPEIKKIPEGKEGELLISIMTAMSDQEDAEWKQQIKQSSHSRRGGKSRKKKRKTKRKKRKTKKRRRKRKRKTKKRR